MRIPLYFIYLNLFSSNRRTWIENINRISRIEKFGYCHFWILFVCLLQEKQKIQKRGRYGPFSKIDHLVFIYKNEKLSNDVIMFHLSRLKLISIIPKQILWQQHTEDSFYNWQFCRLGCRDSWVDSSAPSILPPWVWVQSTPSMLSSI